MYADFATAWPSHIGHNNDHYSFNVRIDDDLASDSIARFSILSRAAGDSEVVDAARTAGATFQARVYIEGSSNHGVLKVGWADTVICRYKSLSDTVFVSHSLSADRGMAKRPGDAIPASYDAVGRTVEAPVGAPLPLYPGNRSPRGR